MSRVEPSFGEMPSELTSLPANDPKVQAWFRQQAADNLTHQRDSYERRVAEASKRVDPPKPAETKKPTSSVQRIAPTREEFQRFTESMQSSAIAGARLAIKSEFKDFDRFASTIDTGMRALDPLLQSDPNNWRSMYYAIKGANADKLVEEALNSERTKSSAERATAAESPKPPDPTPNYGDYSEAEANEMMSKLGVSKESYKANIGKVKAWAPKT
jgi:hypothetical protein